MFPFSKKLHCFSGKRDISEIEDSTIFIARSLTQTLNQPLDEEQRKCFDELTDESVKQLKVMCTKGPSLQNLIINTNGMLLLLNEIVSGQTLVTKELEIKFFQLIANLCVGNKYSQEKIWASMSELIETKLESDDSSFVNVSAMIIYNMILNDISPIAKKSIVESCLKRYRTFLTSPNKPIPDFVHILMDYVMCKSCYSLDIYRKLSTEDQKTTLYYVVDYVEEESNE